MWKLEATLALYNFGTIIIIESIAYLYYSYICKCCMCDRTNVIYLFWTIILILCGKDSAFSNSCLCCFKCCSAITVILNIYPTTGLNPIDNKHG